MKVPVAVQSHMGDPDEDESDVPPADDEAQEEDRLRDNKGRFTAEHSADDVFSAMEIGEPYTTGELAKVTGIPRRTVYEYLDQLSEENLIRKKKPSRTQAIWVRTSE